MSKPTPHDDNRGARNAMIAMLTIPILMCALIGVAMLWSDPSHGLILIALAASLGLINGLILKTFLKKLDEPGSP